MVKYILSYGGGINSSALFFYILENNMSLDEVIFADTGEELKETYKSVEDLKQICKDKNIKFTIVTSPYGNMYDYYYSNNALMSIMKRDCTSKFKVSPIRKYIRSSYGKSQKFVMYIGIAYEEKHRCKKSNVKYIEQVYPFVDDGIDRDGNIEILNKYNFTAIKSGCKGCIFNKKSEWVRMVKEDIKEFERWEKLELNNSRYPKVLLNGQYNLTTLKNNIINQKSLNEFIDPELRPCEVGGGCFL